MWVQENKNKIPMPLRKLNSKHWCAESKAQRYLHWTKVKGLELTHTSEAVLGKRKAGGASRIPWLLSPGSTCCISPGAPCQGAGGCAHLPVIAKGQGVTTVPSTFCPLVCLSPRSCVTVQSSKRTNAENYSTHELQYSVTTLLWS